MSTWDKEVDKINQCVPRQDSNNEQLIDLYYVANKLGFYDAADLIKSLITKK